MNKQNKTTIIRTLRKEKGLSQEELAKLIPVNQTAISQWERGITYPSSNAIKKLCQIFEQPANVFLEIEEKQKPSGIKIPVFSHVAAGVPISAIEDIVDYEEITEELAASGEYFGIIVKGDSMEPRMTTGDVVIVRSQQTAETGDIAIVMIENENATCKKIKMTPEGIMLISLNPSYEPMFYSNKEIEQLPIKIIGKVIELRAKF